MLLVLAVLALANAVSLRIERFGSCDGPAGRETYKLYADLGPGEILRAVDSNLNTASGTTFVLNALQPGGVAPVPPALPTDTCFSYVSWGRINTAADNTWITPDFRWTTTSVAKGWFLSDPTSPQSVASSTSVQIAQFTLLAAATGPCVEGPSATGTLNLILNGTRQNIQNVCFGTGCVPQTVCAFVSGHFAPSMQQPASGFTAPTWAYHLVRPNVAPILLDVSGVAVQQLPTVATAATLGLSTTTVNGARAVLHVSYTSSGSESRTFFNATVVKRVLAVTVRTTTNANSLCNNAIGTVRDRPYSAASYISGVSGGRVTLDVSNASATIDITGLPNSFSQCAMLDYLVSQALGLTAGQYDHRILFLGTVAVCGRTSSSVGAPPAVGGWSVFSNPAGCDSVDAAVNGLLHQFGLISSDARDASSTTFSFGDGACQVGRVPTAEGVQRRSVNAVQLFNLGGLAATAAVLAPTTLRVYSPSHPYNDVDSRVRLVDLSLDWFLSYRAMSDPGVDRQANFSALDANPGGFRGYSGRVLVHRRLSSQQTLLVYSLGAGDSVNPNGVIPIRVDFVDRYSATVSFNSPSPPLPWPVPAPLVSGTIYVDAAAGDTAMQSSNNGQNVLASYNTMPVLQLGVNGNDPDPYVFVRLQLGVPRFSILSRATLLLETSSRPSSATNGPLYLEVAVESADSSAALAPGSNLFVRPWSSQRSRVVSTQTLYVHDEIALDVTLLLQEIVERPGWQANQFVTFRIRNDPARPLQASPPARSTYSGASCGVLGYPCGPRLSVTYDRRTTSTGTLHPDLVTPALPAGETIAGVETADDGLYNTLTETGSPAHAVYQYTFSNLRGVTAATLFVRAAVSGSETWQVQYLRGSSWLTLFTFGAADTARTTKSASIPSNALFGPSLTIRIQDLQSSSAAASSIQVDSIDLFVTRYNVDCILGPAGAFSRCPPCVVSPTQCTTRAIISPPQGLGAACPSQQACQSCSASPCPALSGVLVVEAQVSIDAQQQWKTVQTSDVNSVDLYSVPGIPNAQIGVAGKALSVTGSTLPGGFWVSNNFNQVPGVAQCAVRDIVLTCPSGDAFAPFSASTGSFSGAIVCQNGLIPGPTTPARVAFTVECN